MRTLPQLRVRLSLPHGPHAALADLSPAMRSQAVSALLVAHADGVDWRLLVESVDQIRRVGVLLNQAVHFAHQGRGLDEGRVIDALIMIERLRGKS